MQFQEGNKAAKGHGRPRKDSRKTVWILESLAEHGYDYEAMLVKFLGLAAKGDRHALDMAHLLVKLVPHLANAPKQDVGTTQIETLVINRFDAVKQPDVIEGEVVPNGHDSIHEGTSPEDTITESRPS